MTSPNNVLQEPDVLNTLNSVFDFGKLFSGKNFMEKPVDIVENNNQICVFIEVPGCKSSEITVDIFNNKLMIKARKTCPYKMEDYTFKNTKINYSNINQSITLPIAVTNRENTRVKLENGILGVYIDKSREEMNKFTVPVEKE